MPTHPMGEAEMDAAETEWHEQQMQAREVQMEEEEEPSGRSAHQPWRPGVRSCGPWFPI